jgi:hypothetical protein
MGIYPAITALVDNEMNSIQIAKMGYDCRVEIERDLGTPMHGGPSWVWRCPFHAESTPGGFHVFPSGYNCFSCGAHGDIFDWWCFWRKQTLAEVLRGAGVDPQAIASRAAETAARIERELSQKIAEAQAALAELQAARKWEAYHAALNGDARAIYAKRGIPEWYQDWRKFGYCPDFRVWYNEREYHTPTLTIPIFKTGWECVNIRHRLINPPDSAAGNKYRPERSGLGAHLFLADPDKQPNHDHTLIVEGEFKAAVSFVTLDSDKWQVVGLPGKTPKREIVDQLRGAHAVICLDPDAGEQARTMAEEIDGRVFVLPDKIDDLIAAGAINKNDLRNLIRAARKM